MRTSLLLVAASAALALTACGKKEADKTADAAAPAGAPGTPNPKAGLWEQTMTGEGMGTVTMKICLDEARAAQATAFGNQMQKEKCSKYDMSQGPDGAWNMQSTCDMGTGGVVQSTGKATGDLTSNYKVEATTVTTGAQAPQMNRTSKVALEAKWLGACPPDMAPGSVDMGGMIIDPSGMKGAPQ